MSGKVKRTPLETDLNKLHDLIVGETVEVDITNQCLCHFCNCPEVNVEECSSNCDVRVFPFPVAIVLGDGTVTRLPEDSKTEVCTF